MRNLNELPPEEDRISIREAARILNVHVSAVYRWISHSKLGGWRIGGKHVLSRKEVLAFVRRTGPGERKEADPISARPRMTHAEAMARLRLEGMVP